MREARMRSTAFASCCIGAGILLSCATPRPFPLRAPFLVDTDLRPVSVPCRPDPTEKDPNRKTCAPVEYVSPFVWDQVDNIVFARLSRGLSVEVHGAAVNVNSFDEVPDSAWFTNRPRGPIRVDDEAPGACTPADMLPPQEEVDDGGWLIDHGKDNGSTKGFRINVRGKGKYMLKADDEGKPERASAASVIGSAFFDALGFNTSCEQVVVMRKAQLKLSPGLTVVDNDGVAHPFDDTALDKVLAGTTQVPGDLVRMQASKWLPGLAIGPFRYIGTRADDPNDVIDHANRRELRGARVLSAWLDHWDAREQNSMDIWMAANPKDERSSPGHVVHYFIDTSDTLGGEIWQSDMARRLGYSYTLDFNDIFRSLATFGAEVRPWDRARRMPGREKFGYFRADDFEPDSWKPLYPNPAFLRMTERDAAWMARLIARFSVEDIRRMVALGKWSDDSDAEYLTRILVERQRRLLVRYLGRLSPIGEVRTEGSERICAIDFARLRGVFPATMFHYTVTERGAGRRIALTADASAEGELCFAAQPVVTGSFADGDPNRIVRFEVRNGTGAGPLVIQAYDLGARGVRVVGLSRPEG
jgi:hypothetical protein